MLLYKNPFFVPLTVSVEAYSLFFFLFLSLLTLSPCILSSAHGSLPLLTYSKSPKLIPSHSLFDPKDIEDISNKLDATLNSIIAAFFFFQRPKNGGEACKGNDRAHFITCGMKVFIIQMLHQHTNTHTMRARVRDDDVNVPWQVKRKI